MEARQHINFQKGFLHWLPFYKFTSFWDNLHPLWKMTNLFMITSNVIPFDRCSERNHDNTLLHTINVQNDNCKDHFDVEKIHEKWKTNTTLDFLLDQPTGPIIAILHVRCKHTGIVGPIFSSPDLWAIVTTECQSSVRPLTFHILINSSEATGPIWTKLW
jgi:hypothetical protein